MSPWLHFMICGLIYNIELLQMSIDYQQYLSALIESN